MESSETKNFFVRANEKYSLAEKMELAELVNKEEYDKELKDLEGKTSYDYKQKKHVLMKPKQGFLAAAVRNFYTDLLKVKHDDPNLVKAPKFAKRCHEKYLSNDSWKDSNLPRKGFMKVEQEEKPWPMVYRRKASPEGAPPSENVPIKMATGVL